MGYRIKKRLPGRIRRAGGIEPWSMHAVMHATLNSETRRRQMHDDHDRDDEQVKQSEDLNVVEYTHTAKIERHLQPVACAMVILVRDPTRGGEIRPAVSGSTMDPFAVMDMLTGGLAMLHQVVRYSKTTITPEESRIIQPGAFAVPNLRGNG